MLIFTFRCFHFQVRLILLRRQAAEANTVYLKWREDEDERKQQEDEDRLEMLRRLKDAEAARLAGLRRGESAKAMAWEVAWDEEGKSYFWNRITQDLQYDTPRQYIMNSTCKCLECQITGKMGLVRITCRILRAISFP